MPEGVRPWVSIQTFFQQPSLTSTVTMAAWAWGHRDLAAYRTAYRSVAFFLSPRC
jgi:hypothetical protein